jgi:glycosyltransferase involved in cell wall biosynthesis
MKKIVFLGISGFPRPSAEVEKQQLILNSLRFLDKDVRIISKKNFYVDNVVPYRGTFNGIRYFYTTFYSYKKKNKIENRLRIYFGQIVEKVLLIIDIQDIAIISSRSFLEILSYSVLFKFFKTKIFLTHVEDLSYKESNFLFDKWNKYLFDKFAFRLVDGGLPISEYLYSKIHLSAPNCPLLKLPVLVDYNAFINIKTNESNQLILEKYILYCGSIDYVDVINFIISAYELSDIEVKLVLVVNGHKEHVDNFKVGIKNQNIEVFSSISFEDLVYLYKNADALLIPLRETIQDKARFPHKIGEYCAAGRPIVTNNWGEIPNYFTHLKSAYICKNYNLNDYAEALKILNNNEDLANEIGKNGQILARDIFDYHNFSEPLTKFVTSF